jgi:hypothetical protein
MGQQPYESHDLYGSFKFERCTQSKLNTPCSRRGYLTWLGTREMFQELYYRHKYYFIIEYA